MTRIDTDKYPNLAPLQALCDQQRAIAVMKRYGCYVVPMEIHGGFRWQLRTKQVWDFPSAWLMWLPNRGYFRSPEAALLAAGEYLDAQGKEGR